MSGADEITVTQTLEEWAEDKIEQAVQRQMAAVKQHTDEAITRAAKEAVAEYQNTVCPLKAPVKELQDKTAKLEVRFATLVAFMAGSGILGGGAGVVATKLFGL